MKIITQTRLLEVCARASKWASHVFGWAVRPALWAFTCVGLAGLIVSVESYAAEECSNPNAYLQQTCESLKQSATEAQKAREDRNEKIRAEHSDAIRKVIEEENAPPPAPPPKIPAWQKSLKPPAPPMVENNDADSTTEKTESEEASSEEAPTVAPLPPLGPTKFAGPEPVTLPGGVTVVPIEPKNEGTGKIKYY